MPTLEQLLPLLAAEPGDAFLRYGVAMAYAKAGRLEEAMGEFGELLRRHPGYVAGYFMAGRTAEQQGEPEAAKGFYRAGIAAAEKAGDSHAAGEIGAALAALE